MFILGISKHKNKGALSYAAMPEALHALTNDAAGV